MQKSYQFSLLLVLIAFLMALPGYAHVPYIERLYSIPGPDKKPLIIEELFGDGIISVNPVKMQIRNQSGTVIASTQTATHILVRCSSIQSCWVFSYSSALVEPMHLDYKKLDYSASDPENQSKELSDYVSGRTNRLQTPNLLRPDYRDKPSHFSTGPTWLQLLSPVIIILDNYSDFLGMAILYFLPSLMIPLYWAFANKRNGEQKDIVLIIGLLLLIPYAFFVFINTIIMWSGHALPFVYVFGLIALSIWVGIGLSKSILTRRLKKETGTSTVDPQT